MDNFIALKELINIIDTDYNRTDVLFYEEEDQEKEYVKTIPEGTNFWKLLFNYDELNAEVTNIDFWEDGNGLTCFVISAMLKEKE